MLEGSTSLLRSFEVAEVPITVIGVEDLIITRLVIAKHWRTPEVHPHAVKLYKDWSTDIDSEYLIREAQRQHVDDVLTKIMGG
jgi:hypothetical protein